MVKMAKDHVLQKFRLAGRDDVLVLPLTLLTQSDDGNYYYDKSNILKVYSQSSWWLMSDDCGGHD